MLVCITTAITVVVIFETYLLSKTKHWIETEKAKHKFIYTDEVISYYYKGCYEVIFKIEEEMEKVTERIAEGIDEAIERTYNGGRNRNNIIVIKHLS